MGWLLLAQVARESPTFEQFMLIGGDAGMGHFFYKCAPFAPTLPRCPSIPPPPAPTALPRSANKDEGARAGTLCR